jgi:CRP-like cAMP-binding protein
MDRTNDILIRKLKEHSELEPEDIAGLYALPKTPRLVANQEDIVRQGDAPKVSVIVLNGLVARYKTCSNGARQYVSFHLAGDWPDVQSLFLERMDHGVCAMGEVLVALVPHHEILALFEKRPRVGFAIWRETLIDAAIFREAVTRVGARPVLARLAHLFCELYYRARASGLTKPGACPLPLHQGQLGETLGISIVTANRALQQLRRTGTMEFREGNLAVHDWKRLCEIADFDPGYLNLKRPGRL